MPAVEEANSISEELDKKVKFEIMLISATMREKLESKGEVILYIRHNFEQGWSFWLF